MVCDLRSKKCRPCEGIGRTLNRQEAAEYLSAVPDWTITDDGKSVVRVFIMKDFTAAVRAITAIADVANGEDHHPDVHLTKYRRLTVEFSTHALGGLTENDFIVAAKIDALPMELKK